MDGPGADPARRAVHRTVLVVDVERFGDLSRTDPHRIVVRRALYRVIEAGMAHVNIGWADCHVEDRGDGILVLIPPEVTKSVLVDQLPGELIALLDEHNTRHGPGERIRLRMAIHAGEIYQDPHGVVGEALNLTYRLVDSADLKSAHAAKGRTGPLGLIVSDWFYREVVQHSMTGDAAAYRRVRVVVKETDAIAWLRIPGTTDQEVPEPSHPGSSALWRASDASEKRLGSRRTAYPVDLSIAELHNQGLYVPATFSTTGQGPGSVSVEEIADAIEAGSSVLILGEPGSGKSVAAYALLRRLRQRIPAVAVRMTALTTALRDIETADGSRAVLLIDGLDETLGEFASAAELSQLLNRLSEQVTIVVTCRQREFEDNLARSMDNGVFHSIHRIDPWTLAGQFTAFITRLAAAGRLGSTGLLTVVARSPDLEAMIARPLYARMLTFLGRDRLHAVTGVPALYAEYIDNLAAASDTALTSANCRMSVSSEEVWVDAAWQIFAQSMTHEDRFSFDPVVSRLAERTGEQPRCLERALSQICDRWRAAGHVWGRFVHYSFFEYLVSRYYVGQLNRAAPDEPGLTECLSIDLSPEIRHFVVDELRVAPVPGLAGTLEQAYVRLRAADLDVARVRTTGNLIAYLLSRAVQDGQATLRRLLAGEGDMFLQQSLLWGLCHLGDSEALAKFVRESRSSAQWRAWNRGYLMYYYGDIDRQADPPYVDEDRQRSWRRTRERSIALMSANGYHETIPPQRRYLDLYILYDYAVWRGEELSASDSAVAGAALDWLWTDPAVESDLLRELHAMHAVVCRSDR